jgi:ABC-type transporter Mla subunit MlaD
VRFDVHHHYDSSGADDKFDRVLKLLEKIMDSLTVLTAQVAANTTVIGSALTLINGFAAALAAAGTDPAKLADLASQLKTQDDALAAAVAANTTAKA